MRHTRGHRLGLPHEGLASVTWPGAGLGSVVPTSWSGEAGPLHQSRTQRKSSRVLASNLLGRLDASLPGAIRCPEFSVEFGEVRDTPDAEIGGALGFLKVSRLDTIARYCTTFVATFWTVDIVVTMRTGFYQQGNGFAVHNSAFQGDRGRQVCSRCGAPPCCRIGRVQRDNSLFGGNEFLDKCDGAFGPHVDIPDRDPRAASLVGNSGLSKLSRPKRHDF